MSRPVGRPAVTPETRHRRMQFTLPPEAIAVLDDFTRRTGRKKSEVIASLILAHLGDLT